MSLFITVFILSYLYHGFGITVGYHRLLSHRAFKVPAWLEYFIVSGGYLAFEGSPVSWVSTHRVHHRYTDDEGDPHKPADGFWHAYAAWLVKPRVVLSPEQIEQVCPDLCRDPIYSYFDFNHTRKHALVCLISCIVFRIIIFLLLGPWAVVANVLAAVTVFNAPFLVNSVCHLPHKGYKNFDTSDDSRNVWWVGLMGLGEGWHNNHHAVPQSARHGMLPIEFDLSWCAIATMKALGLATNVHMPKEPKLAPIINPALAKQLNAANGMTSELDNESDVIGVMPSVFIGRGIENPLAAAPEFEPDRQPVATDVRLATVAAAGATEAGTMEQLQVARARLLEQLNAARSLSVQITDTYDHLQTQVIAAPAQFAGALDSTKEQMSDQLVAARGQLVDQLITTCDELAAELSQASNEMGQKLTKVKGQLSEHLVPLRTETERA
jgi:fatty-acid desaturase